MRASRAYTVVELVVVVAILAAMAWIAVPRLNFGLVQDRQAEITAWRIATVLRRTRSMAICDAATNSKGFLLRIRQTGPATWYEIVDQDSQDVVVSEDLDSDIALAGRTLFEFSPLGALKEANAPELTVSGDGRAFVVRVVPPTGMVTWSEAPGSDARGPADPPGGRPPDLPGGGPPDLPGGGDDDDDDD